MADLGHELTDKELKKLEKRMRDEYYIAQRDTRKKLQDYLEQMEEGRKKQKALLDAGKISKQEYKDWCYRHAMVGQRWKDMLTTLAEDYHHTNEIALAIARQGMPDIYALNMNYATWDLEHKGRIDTGFTLYNHDTAAYLLKDQRQLMPGPSTKKQREIAANKDMQWNMQKIQSAVLQGVLQGESPYAVAKRLQQVADMDYRASVRYARTMTTSAQNAGRYEAFRRAKRLGVDLTIEWQATLDNRTRHEHRMMHGQRTDVDKPFHTPDGYTIYYPADCSGASDAPQSEIWNCRCTLLSWVKGFEGDTVKSSPKMEGKSFEEWQHEKEPSPDKKSEKAKAFTSHAKPVTITVNQTFTDKVNAVRDRIAQNGGAYTEDDIKEAGSYLAKEFDELVNTTARRLRGEDYADWLADKLSQVREVGSQGIDIKAHFKNSRSPAVKDLTFAYSHYPKEWVEKSVAYGNIELIRGSRGYYNHFLETLCMDDDGHITAFHELGHRFEAIMPDMLKVEKDFYARRTQGNPLKWMGSGYRKNEQYRDGGFLSKYIGKDYGGTAYEVVSMGFQYAYTDPKYLAYDTDFQNLIYGILLLG